MINRESAAKGKPVKVTFELPADVAERSVSVVGDFNNWDASKGKMKLEKKTQRWSKSVSIKPGTYQFRYFVDEAHWRNDEQADRYEGNEFGSENGVIQI